MAKSSRLINTGQEECFAEHVVLGGGDSLSSSPDEDHHATIPIIANKAADLADIAGFGRWARASGCPGVPGCISSGSRASATAKAGNPVVQAFLSETPLPAGAEFLKHIEKSQDHRRRTCSTWTKHGDTTGSTCPNAARSPIDGFCDLGLMKRDGKVFRLLYTARVQFGPARAAGASADDQLWPTLVSRPGQNPDRGRPSARPARLRCRRQSLSGRQRSGRAQDRRGWAHRLSRSRPGPNGSSRQMDRKKSPGKLDGKPFDEIRHYATLTVDPGPVRRRRPKRRPPRSRCFPRPSTALAGQSSATGYTSTAGTPGQRTSIIREHHASTSAD